MIIQFKQSHRNNKPRKAGKIFYPGFLTILLAVLFMMAISCNQTDKTDETVLLTNKKLPVDRIISLNPAVTEILFYAGAGNKVVGVSTFCNYPSEATNLPKVGEFSPDTVNIESILALKPDIVIGELSVHSELVGKFKNAGIELVMLKLVSVEDISNAIQFCGKVAGTQKTADKAADNFENKIEKIVSPLSGISETRKPSVFLEIWYDPLMTAGPNTFMGKIVELAGGKNCFGDVKQDWPMISSEQLIIRNPSIIIMPKEQSEELDMVAILARPGWDNMDAVKNGRIFTVEYDIISRPGPRMVEALEIVSRLLHPELFNK